jgi:hypothetical protein
VRFFLSTFMYSFVYRLREHGCGYTTRASSLVCNWKRWGGFLSRISLGVSHSRGQKGDPGVLSDFWAD